MSKIASALIVYNHKLLLHLRDEKHPDPNLRNKWGLVGGGVDDNETPQIAILREIKEESNLEPKAIHFIGKLVIDRPENHIEAYLFCTIVTKKEANKLRLGNEGKAIKFFSPEEMKSLKLSPGVSSYYKKYQKVVDTFVEKGILPIIKSPDFTNN
jgi:ADP-ribose pyrophosphatase YjhB (NUDIX family)